MSLPCSLNRVLLLVALPLALLIFAVRGAAQSAPGAISGTTMDSSGAILQGASIAQQPTGFSATSNVQGEFVVRDLPAGSYTVKISFVGFTPFTTTVTVISGQVTRLDATLVVAGSNDQVIVTSDLLHGEAEAINRERTADNILQVLPADVITSLPNANIADALGRMPGVSLERDEGEGKYVQVRSLEPRLTNLTIDGVNVPSPEAGVRQVKLDTVPADLVESVEINKTLQANQDGDGIGGSVNLVTKTAEDRPTVSLYGLGGYTPIVDGRNVYEGSGTVGQRFGSSKKLGVLLGGHYDWNGRGIDDIEPTPDAIVGASGATVPYYDSMDIREYRYYRTRWGLAGSVDYKLGGQEGSSLYARALYSDFKDYGDKWVFSINDNSNLTGMGTGNDPKFKSSSRRPDYAISSLVGGGRHEFTSMWAAWDLSISRSRQTDSAGNPGPDFSYTGPDSNCEYDAGATTDEFRPQFLPVCFTEAYNQANYQLQDIVLSRGKSAQVNLQATGAVGKRYHLGSHLATFQFGGKFRNAHKFDDSYTLGYDPTINLPDTLFLNSFQNNDYYNKTYSLGPVTSYNKILAYFRANPGNFTEEPADAAVDTNTTIGGNPANFDLIEKVSAGFVMNTIDLGKFHIVTGLRIEGTNLDTSTFQMTTAADGTITDSFVKAHGSYVKLLPSGSVRYALTQNSAIRAVYGRGLSRPDPQDIAQAYTIDNSASPSPTVSLGNPNLKAEYANNYDLLYEQYLNPLGMISAGFFYKQLYDPIVDSTTNPTTGPFAGYQVTQPVNIGSAWLRGFEVGYIQHLSFLPGVLRGLGISANYAYTDSQASGLQALGRTDHPALVRQAPNTWNISPTYDRGRVSMRLGMTYNDRNIYQYQFTDGVDFGKRGPFGDIYFYPHFQFDAQTSIRIAKGFTAVVYGLNINNEVFGFYNGSPQYVLQREYYSPTIAAGLRWSPLHEK
jgi:TonB-dependent receptor